MPESEAVLKALNHVLWTMCRKTLKHWIPRPADILRPGDGKLVLGSNDEPAPLSTMPVIRFVTWTTITDSRYVYRLG